MLPTTHWLVRVQGVGEDTLSNMFPFFSVYIFGPRFYYNTFLICNRMINW